MNQRVTPAKTNLNFWTSTFPGLENNIKKDKQVDDPNNTAEVVPMYLLSSLINSIIWIIKIDKAIPKINPKNKYFVLRLISKADSIFIGLRN